MEQLLAPPRNGTHAQNGVYPTAVWRSPQLLFEDLLKTSLVIPEDWEALPALTRAELAQSRDTDQLLDLLIGHKLLTHYQSDRIKAGKTYGLILGNYRVTDRLGSGGMGVVFKAEHTLLRRVVAIKVLPISHARSGMHRNLQRFYGEMRTVAQLQHPNIVSALDAGVHESDEPGNPTLHYYVMEFVKGNDLEEHVQKHGAMAPSEACEVMHQIAGALAAAHEMRLVHRDMKPANVLLTVDHVAKLLDFGLVRQFHHRMTEPGTVLGTIEYIAPEQAYDASGVDIRADIYGLGGTLFWCLTGKSPFSLHGNIAQELAARQMKPPPSIRHVRPDLSAELDAVIARMMAPNPENRYPTPQVAMNALVPFLRLESQETRFSMSWDHRPDAASGLTRVDPQRPTAQRVLVVDDEPEIRSFCSHVLRREGIGFDVAGNATEALAALGANSYDLVLLDWSMPGMTGLELCRLLRQRPIDTRMKIILCSGRSTIDELPQVLDAGADEFLTKPFSLVHLVARIRAALKLKEAQDRADQLNRHLFTVNQQLEQSLMVRDRELVHARNALVLALAKLVGCRDVETGGHLIRLQRFCRRLAEEASGLPALTSLINPDFVQNLECCVPLHDIGKVGLPDYILLKDGRLDPDERIIMQTHTTIGADMLDEVAKLHGPAVEFLRMAIAIARHHHERFDGKGYPDRLVGDAIPLPARITTIADVYDALRSRRSYKPALGHKAALQVMLETSAGQFDPNLLHVFERCAPDFERIFKELPD